MQHAHTNTARLLLGDAHIGHVIPRTKNAADASCRFGHRHISPGNQARGAADGAHAILVVIGSMRLIANELSELARGGGALLGCHDGLEPIQTEQLTLVAAQNLTALAIDECNPAARCQFTGRARCPPLATGPVPSRCGAFRRGCAAAQLGGHHAAEHDRHLRREVRVVALQLAGHLRERPVRMLIEPDAHHLAGSVKVDVLHVAVPQPAPPRAVTWPTLDPAVSFMADAFLTIAYQHGYC